MTNRIRAGGLVLLALALLTSGAKTQGLPKVGFFTEADRQNAQTYVVEEHSFEDGGSCLISDGEPSVGAYSDNDTAHYPRGSALCVLIFIDHDGGTWDIGEQNDVGAKASLAKDYYLEYMPPEGFLTFDHEGNAGYYYYEASVPYDISQQDGILDWITDAAEDLGFSDNDGDGSVIDEMTIWLQGRLGGWDNVILTFTPADYNFRAEASTGPAWCKIDQYEDWVAYGHEWGHVFGACDEYPADGENDCDPSCDEVCQSWYLTEGVVNGNCVFCDVVPCIMKSSNDADEPPCPYTHGNWAWVDANDDGRLDPTIGFDPEANDTYTIHEISHGGWWIHTNETWGMVANQKWTSWSAIGVRSRGSSNWSVRVFGENNLNHHIVSDFLSSGVKFVVGDFNHNNLGGDYIRLLNTGGAGQYVLSYEAGNQVFYPDGVDRAQTWSGNNVVRAYDVPLFAGETIEFQLNIDTTELDLGMALFKSNGDVYYAPRGEAVWEEDDWPAGISESHIYNVPEDDVYGLVVWSETEVAGDFSVKIGPSLFVLDEADPFVHYGDLALYSYAPYTNYWAVSAARPGESSNVRLRLFEESTFETLLATSGAYPNVEFIAADYNPGYSTDYLRVNRQSGINAHATEWEQGSDILAGVEGDTWEAGHVCKVWDAHLVAGQEYRFQQWGTTDFPIETRIHLVSSADGDRYIQRSDAEVGGGAPDPLGTWFAYTPAVDDWYGFVMTNDDDSEGPYQVAVGPHAILAEQSPVGFDDEVIFADFTTQAGSWAVAGVRPEPAPGAVSSIYVWNCEDRVDPCFVEGDDTGDLVRYVVFDGNHDSPQTYYAGIRREAGNESHSVSFDIAPDNDIAFDDPDQIEVAAGSFVEDEVVRVWDLNVTTAVATAPIAVGITVVPLAEDLDVSLAVFSSTGGDYIQPSGQAVASAEANGPGGSERVSFDVDSGDIYGVVVTNRSGFAGDYEIDVYDAESAGAGEEAAPERLDLRARGSVSSRPTLELSLPEQADVRLDVFDVTGRHLRVLADGRLSAGRHEFAWDGRTDGGSAAGTGVFFVRLQALGEERTLKVVRQM